MVRARARSVIVIRFDRVTPLITIKAKFDKLTSAFEIMRYLLLLLILTPFYSIGQDSLKIVELTSRKIMLENSIKTLSDSLMKINHEILLIEAKNNMNAKDEGAVKAFCSAGTKIRSNPNPVSPLLVTLVNDDSLLIVDFYDGYFRGKIRFNIWVCK